MCVFRQKQKWLLKTPSLVKASCLPTSSYHPLLTVPTPISPDEPGTVLGSLQEPKRARLGSAHPSPCGVAGGRAGRAWGSSPRSVRIRLFCEHFTESFTRAGNTEKGGGAWKPQSPVGEQGEAVDPSPGLSFPLWGALAPPPGAGSGCGDPPRPPRLPPPGHVRGALPEACAGPREAAAAAKAPRLVALHPAPPPLALGLRAVPAPAPGPALPAPGGPGPARSGGAPQGRPPRARPGPGIAAVEPPGLTAPALPAGSRGPPGVPSSWNSRGRCSAASSMERWRWRDGSHLPGGRGSERSRGT